MSIITYDGGVFTHLLAVGAHGDREDKSGDVVKHVDPLTPLRPLTARVEQSATDKVIVRPLSTVEYTSVATFSQ